MSQRTATINFQAKGLEQVDSTLAGIDKAIARTNTNLRRQVEVAEQKEKGTGISWAEIASAKKGAQDTAETLSSMATSRQVLQSTMEKATGGALEAIAGKNRAKNASEARADALRYIAADKFEEDAARKKGATALKNYNDEKKASESIGKKKDAEYAGRAKELEAALAMGMRDNNTKADFAKTQEKSEVDANKRHNQITLATIADNKKAEAERIAGNKAHNKATLAQIEENKKTAETSLRFVETGVQQKLRILDQAYAKERQLHAGNAEALAKIDAAYAAKRNQLMAGGAGGAGGVGEAEIQKGALGALVQMGSKRILRQGAGMVAQQMFNTPGIGQEIGLIVGGALYGGPTIAGMAALGGIAAVGAAVAAYFRDANEDAKQATESTKKFSEALIETSSSAAKLAGGLLPITQSGAAMESMADKMRSAVLSLSADKVSKDPQGTFGIPFHRIQQAVEATPMKWFGQDILGNVLQSLSGEQLDTSYGRGLGTTNRQIDFSSEMMKFGETAGGASRSRRMDNERVRSAEKIHMLESEGMHPGPQRDRIVFEEKLAAAATKRLEDNKEAAIEASNQVAIAEKALEYANAENDAAASLSGDHAIEKVAAQAALDIAKERLKVTRQFAAQLPNWQYEQEAAAKRADSQEKVNFGTQQGMKLATQQRQDAERYRTSAASGVFHGWALEQENIKSKRRLEKAAYEDAGRSKADIAKLDAIYREEDWANYVDRKDRIKEEAALMADQTRVARREMTQAEAEWAAKSRQILREGSDDEKRNIGERKKTYFDFVTSQSDTKFSDMMQTLGLRKKVLRGEEDPAVLIREQLKKDNPLWTDDELNKATKEQRETEITERARQNTLRLHPMKQYEEEVKKLQEEEKVLKGTKSERTTAETKRLTLEMGKRLVGSVFGGGGGGQFMDAVSYSRSIQSSLIQGNDIPKEILAELRKINAVNNRLEANGFPLKG